MPLSCLLPGPFFYLLSGKNLMRANKKRVQAASRWQVVAGRLRFICIRAWWRLLLALRVPAPLVPGRAGLWFPWHYQSWRSVSYSLLFVLSALRLVLIYALLAFFPWLAALLLSRWLQ
jgi:hypothetical protein